MTVAVLPGGEPEAQVWATSLEVSRLFADVPWVLIGAQMVMLLEREAGRPSGRTTGDVDAVVDVRVLTGGTGAAAARLVAAGYEPDSAEHPHRFVRTTSQVDLLAPRPSRRPRRSHDHTARSDHRGAGWFPSARHETRDRRSPWQRRSSSRHWLTSGGSRMLGTRARVELAAGNGSEAAQLATQAETAERTGNGKARLDALLTLGRVERAQGRLDSAMEYVSGRPSSSRERGGASLTESARRCFSSPMCSRSRATTGAPTT